MPALHPDLRRLLERTIIAARQVAEEGAKTVLQSLAVNKDSPFDAMTPEQREQRRRLRAEERRLGGFEILVSEVAYEAWHSRLFARFLLENNLLMYEGFAVSTEDLRDAEVQSQFGVHTPEALAVALAAQMLPGLFQPQDPAWKLPLPPEHASQLEHSIDELPKPIFEADDSLGWVYQFWQTEEKKRVDATIAAGNRVNAGDMPAKTQLFTEPYMVDWLLDQALAPLLQDPDRDYSQLKVLDPSCGSGHFLVAAFGRIVSARMNRTGLSEAETGNAVLAENLYGLELDPRCVQLAGFNLIFTAWKKGGYRDVPLPQVACSGLPAGGSIPEWQALALDDPGMQNAMIRLYQLFEQAPILGSLLDPRSEAGYIPWEEVAPALEKALEKFGDDDDPVAAILGEGARGLMRAARILAGQYDLVVTNVPYLARGKQNPQLAEFCAKKYPASKSELATVFIERSLQFCKPGGFAALVTPQNWLFLGSYKTLREKLLRLVSWKSVAKLGENGFTSSAAAGAFVALFVLRNQNPDDRVVLRGWDVSEAKTPEEKAAYLLAVEPIEISQAGQLRNPDARISFDMGASGTLLAQFAVSPNGLHGADSPRFRFQFWETSDFANWRFLQGTCEDISLYDGRSTIFYWAKDGQQHKNNPNARIQGGEAWGKRGVVVSLMRQLPSTLYTGEMFDISCSPIVPKDPNHLSAIWCFCSSPEFNAAVRRIDQKMNVTNATLVKIPFDLERWQKVAQEQYPNGLPEPFSDDPTQWLFSGDPQTANARGGEATLQVASARLMGYRWPQQEADELGQLSDEDGILPLVAVSGETAGHERLRQILEVALDDFSPGVLESLLADAGYGGKTLEAYLRNGFFQAHCRMFHNRPFLWHIWDGRADGFAAIVNYHKLNYARLEKLTYTYLGDYLKVQRDGEKQEVQGAGARLAAGEELQRKLIAILEGEPPYDIYVRWKKLEKQPLGWNPDLNDGVRLNIRPFVEAGILRSKFTVKWGIDRGKNPDGRERNNDVHLTLAEKRAAREQQM